MDAEPGHVRELPVDLVVVLADLRDRGAAADHRHDALVLVVERLSRLALEVGEDVLRRPLPLCRATEPSCGSVSPSGPGMLAMSPTTYTPGRTGERQVGLRRRCVPRALGEAAVGGERRRRDARRPRSRSGSGSCVPSESSAWPVPTSLTPVPRRSWTRRSSEHLGDVPVGLVGERACSSASPKSSRSTCAAVASRSWYSAGTVTAIMSASAPATSTPVGPAADDHEVERAALHQRRVAVDLFEQAEDP